MNFEHIKERLFAAGSKYFYDATPFPHIVVDDFLAWEDAEELFSTFPRVDDNWYRYSNPFEEKRALDDVSKMPARFAEKLLFLNSGPFVKLMSEVTGIEDLTADPYLRGGGCHAIPELGFLDVHSDFGRHPKLNLYRRLNALLYLNKSPPQGGELELWNSNMSRCVRSIEPIFNRFVLFETSATSYHGHPNPWRSSEYRKSIALYFYTASAPTFEINAQSTKFQRLPNEPLNEEKEALRLKRNLGRLNSNI